MRGIKSSLILFIAIFGSSVGFFSNQVNSEPICYLENEQRDLIDLTSLCVNEKFTNSQYASEVIRLVKRNGSPETVPLALNTVNSLIQQGELYDEAQKLCAALRNGNSPQQLLEKQSQIVSEADAEKREAIQLSFEAINSAALTVYCPQASNF